jgi:hypothetical protein
MSAVLLLAATLLASDFGRYFTNGSVGGVPMSVVAAGSVAVPSGRVVVGDPFFLPAKPLTRQVKAGTYPVELAIARSKDWGKRVAFARMRISDAPVARWEEAGSFGVDAGLACILDATTAQTLEKAMAAFDKRHPKGNYYEDVLARDLPGDALWGSHRPDPGKSGNAIVFSSGLGDGAYTCYWGLDAKGGVAQLVVDLQVVE